MALSALDGRWGVAGSFFWVAVLPAIGSWTPRLSAGDHDVAISEVHYHPPLEAGGDERLEFLELANLGDEPAILDGWVIDGGVFFQFPADAIIAPRGYLVVARDAAYLEASYGISEVQGDFTGRLSNDGEVVELRNGRFELIDRVDWRDEAPWPENPDGLGPSLEKTGLLLDGQSESSWRSSIPLGGTPGERNSTDATRVHRTLIAAGDAWKHKKGTAEPSSPIAAWTGRTFDDTSWSSGPSGFGYGDNDDATILSDMEDGYTTVYLRGRFSLTSPGAIESLVLSIVYDDAYVAYLNGTEVARSATAGGTPGTPLAHDATAADTHENTDGTDSIELASFRALLHAGDNVLAIQVLNEGLGSSDLSMIPTLVSTEVDGTGLVEPPHDLEINEVFAGSSPAEGFVEVHNEAAQPADVSGFRIVTSAAGSGGYAFPAGTTIAAGARRVVPAAGLPFALTDAAQWLGLVTPDLRFVDGVETRARPAGRSWGRYPDGDGDTFVLASPTPGAANTVSLEQSVVIDEIRYHPPFGEEIEEYIELHNRGSQAVDLTGWSLTKAVGYTFGSVSIPPGGYLVVSGNPAAVMSRYGISGVLGPWSGRLADGAEKIELEDELGNRADVVHYADDGRWPLSTTSSGPDGHGPSVELVHPGSENNHGSAWLASSGIGTPGVLNSRHADDPAPVIRSVAHDPPVPRSTEAVTVTARVSDERGVASVRLFSRPDASGTFAQLAMLDDGLHGDGAAGDGTYGATLAARADTTIVQFYVEATDGTAHSRRFPSDAPTRVCLYQVDDRGYPAELPLYRAILRAADETELETRDLYSDVPLDGTFIHGKDIFYGAGIRYRGENSRHYAVKSFRIDLSSDETFGGIKKLNLNAEDVHLARLAADFLRRADVPVFQTLPVAFTLNGAWQTKHAGVYLRIEAVDDDFLERVFPGDATGNLYRGRNPSGAGEGDLTYLGPDPASYVTSYEKKTNEALDDYSDIIALTDAFTNTSDEDFQSAMEGLIDVDEWLRYFAVETVLNNQDGAISTDSGEDYFIYRRPSDGRWVLLPWDQNENFGDPTAGIFRMGIAGVRRLVLHPVFVRWYLADLIRLLDGPFAPAVMAGRISLEEGVFSPAALEEIARFVPIRQTAIRELIPRRLTAGVEPRYLARTGDEWRYFKGTREPSGGTTAWTGVAFDDSTWLTGPGGFGYGDGDDRTVLADMQDGYTTVYVRRAFDLASAASIDTLTLSIRFDDGFVFFLNGTEVARADVTGSVAFDERADADHEAGAPRIVDLTSRRSLLRTGRNVIAAVGVNSSSGSSDLTLDPELWANPDGSGCGVRLFAASPSLTLGGTYPVIDAFSVSLNGSSVDYDSVTGRWHEDVALPAGSSTYEVVALDALSQEIARTSVEVVRAGGLSTIAGTVATATWTEAGGPYHVTGTVTVPAGASLTIEPGVAVYADSGVTFVVRGTLEANGTVEKPVTFQGSSCGSSWGGIAFLGASAHGTLRHLRLTGASSPTDGSTSYRAAISLDDGAQVRFEGGSLSGLDGAAVHAAGGSELTVTDSIVEDAIEGIVCDASYADIERATFRNVSGLNISLDGESAPRSLVLDCVLEKGPVEAIELVASSARVAGNVVRGATGEGITVIGACSPILDRNVVHDCGVGIALEDGSTPVLTHATITACNLGLHVHEQSLGAGGSRAVADSLIIWGNARSVIVDALSSLDLTFSDVEGGFPGAGNISQFPMFVDARLADFHLRPGSPAAGTGKGGEDMGAYPVGEPTGRFTRGDANSDGSVDVSDGVKILLYLFGGNASAACLDALDADDLGTIDITDALYVLRFLFQGASAPPSPFPDAGPDPTETDALSCDA